MKRFFFGGLAIFCVASASAALLDKPRITDLSVVQESGRRVSITFKIAAAPAVVTVDILTNALADASGSWGSVGGGNLTAALSGDVGRLLPNGDETRTIVWRPRVSLPARSFERGMAKAVVTAWSAEEPPTFMVVDLTNEVNRFTYYADKASLPGGIGDRAYKTTKILFRRIPAAGVTWKMGSPTSEGQRGDSEDLHDVTLTEDYYMAVYETTMKQFGIVQAYYNSHKAASDPEWLWYYVNNYENSGYDAETKEVCPYNTASYFKLRGKDDALYNWPANGHDVAPNGFMGVLRAMTGGKLLFDLPTEAQWEFAARAGTTTEAYFGVAYNYAWNANTANLDANTWWWGNSDVAGDGSKKIPHPVGMKTANAFDLYDVLGNVLESCLDQYTAHLGVAEAVDPTGPKTGAENPRRVVRGGTAGVGSIDHYARWAIRSAYRLDMLQQDNPFWGESNHIWGFRICAPAVAK